MSEEEAYKIFSEMTPDVLDYVFCLAKAYTEKGKEIERLNNIINGIDEILKEHINECREELNMIMKSDNFDYINECSREFDVIRKNIEMIMKKTEELKGSDKE